MMTSLKSLQHSLIDWSTAPSILVPKAGG